MAISSGKARLTITVPVSLSDALQREADRDKLTVSELITAIIMRNRRADTAGTHGDPGATHPSRRRGDGDQRGPGTHHRHSGTHD
jgi:hypothetical protein